MCVSVHPLMGFPCGSADKQSTCNVGDLDLIPGLERFPGEGKGYPLQYSGLENSLNCINHGVAKSRTRLSDFHFHDYHSFSSTEQVSFAWYCSDIFTYESRIGLSTKTDIN